MYEKKITRLEIHLKWNLSWYILQKEDHKIGNTYEMKLVVIYSTKRGSQDWKYICNKTCRGFSIQKRIIQLEICLNRTYHNSFKKFLIHNTFIWKFQKVLMIQLLSKKQDFLASFPCRCWMTDCALILATYSKNSFKTVGQFSFEVFKTIHLHHSWETNWE